MDEIRCFQLPNITLELEMKIEYETVRDRENMRVILRELRIDRDEMREHVRVIQREMRGE